MGVDFYYMPLSAPSRAALLTAKALGVPLNVKRINLMAGEQRKPEYLKMNPQHTVPTIDHDGFYLNESRAIILYLFNVFGKGHESLYPSDPKQRAIVDHRLFFDIGTLYQRFADYYYPIMFRGGSLESQNKDKLDEALEWLDGHLKKTKYVAADNLTLADYSIVATVSSIESVGHDLTKFTNVTSWLSRCKKEMDGYDEWNQPGAEDLGDIAKKAMKNKT